MSAMSFSVTQQEHAELVPVAAYYAQQIMEDIRINRRHVSVPPPGVPAASSGVNSGTKVDIDAVPMDALFNRIKDTNGDNVLDSNDQFLNLDRYQRTITMQRLSTNPNNYPYNLIRVTVTIFWKETTGVDSKNSGNSSLSNSGARQAVTRSLQIEAVLD